MSYLGSWKIDDLLTFYANTTRFDTGAATDADAVPAYRVYEDETGTAILTGNMALIDSSNTAGFYSEQITLSAANGFEKGKCYGVYISAAVNSVTGATHHTLQIEAEVDANTVSGTVANVTTVATTTNLTNLPAITANWLTAAGTAADFTTEIQTGLATAASIAALNNISTAQVNSEVDTALADIHLDHLIAVADPGSIVANSSLLAKLTSKSATPAFTSFDNTTDSLEAIRDKETDIETDTQDIQGRLPAALVSGRMDSNVQAMANDVITSSVVAASATAEFQNGLSTLDAAGVRTAVGLTLANLDTQLDALPTNAELATALGTADDATLAAIAALSIPSASTIASAVAAIVIETGYSLTQVLQLIAAATAGKLSGAATTTNTFRNLPDSANRITATVDSDGNRTAVTHNV